MCAYSKDGCRPPRPPDAYRQPGPPPRTHRDLDLEGRVRTLERDLAELRGDLRDLGAELEALRGEAEGP
jgi:hypothetical protein